MSGMKEFVEDRIETIIAHRKGIGADEPMLHIVEAHRQGRIVATAFSHPENLYRTIDLMHGYMPDRLFIAVDANFTSVENFEDSEELRNDNGRLDPSKPGVEEGIVTVGVSPTEHHAICAPYFKDEFGNFWFMDAWDLGNDGDSGGPITDHARQVVKELETYPEDLLERDCETSVGILRSGTQVLLFGEEGQEERARAYMEHLINEAGEL